MTRKIRDEDGQVYVPIDFDVILVDRELSYLFDMGDKQVWLPKSQIIDIDNQSNEVTIPEWLAIEKELV